MKRKRPSDLIRGVVDRRMLVKDRVWSGRVLRAVGASKREVVRNETCKTPLLVSTTTPGISASPGSQVSVLGPQGGAESLAVEAVIVGRNVGSEEQGHSIGAPAAPTLSYLAFYQDGASSFTVKSLGADGSEIETLVDNVTLPFGTLTASQPLITIISGDLNVPDNSFTIGDAAGSVWTVDITSGLFTSIFNVGIETMAYRGVHWDGVTQKVYVAVADGIDTRIGRLYSVNANGSAGVLVQAHTSGTISRAFTPAVWGADRCLMYGIAPYSETTEFPFAGGFTNRPGDAPADTVYLSNGAVVDFFSGGDRYFVDLDAATGTYFECYRMPLTSGNAVSQGWPASTFFPGQADTIFAAKVGDELCVYPVLDSASGTDVYILRWDVTGAAPDTSNLILVSSATTGPVAPFCVLPVPA